MCCYCVRTRASNTIRSTRHRLWVLVDRPSHNASSSQIVLKPQYHTQLALVSNCFRNFWLQLCVIKQTTVLFMPSERGFSTISHCLEWYKLIYFSSVLSIVLGRLHIEAKYVLNKCWCVDGSSHQHVNTYYLSHWNVGHSSPRTFFLPVTIPPGHSSPWSRFPLGHSSPRS